MDKTIIHREQTIFYRDLLPDVSADTSNIADTANIADVADIADLPVVLLHGFAEDGAIWDRQINPLKKNFRLIVPDLPGSGRSSALTAATSMEELADAIALILDAEKIGQAILIGHSMGGYIALAFAGNYPGRCAGLGLFHSTAYPDSEEKKATRRKSMAFIHKHGAAEFIRQSTSNLFADPSREQHPEWIAALTERYENFDPDSLVHYYQAMIDRPDRTNVLARSGLPTLFIIGRHDNTIPFQTSLQQSHLPSTALIHILERSGHMGMIEQTTLSNKILEEFLHFSISHSRNFSIPASSQLPLHHE